jgi:hypothetical protein
LSMRMKNRPLIVETNVYPISNSFFKSGLIYYKKFKKFCYNYSL